MDKKYELTPKLRKRLEQKKKRRLKRKSEKRNWKAAVGIVAVAALLVVFLYKMNILPQWYYDNADFAIKEFQSSVDQDGDGIDDQTDILQGVRDYIATKPKYKSVYYATGYPNDEYGVCTDVVANGLLAAGYDLMELVSADIAANREDYEIDIPDKKIDFRRVRNLYVYFQNTAISLTTDVTQIDQWQGGDIVVFKSHIGVVSDNRNVQGIPYVIHHGSPTQIGYEQDILMGRDDIIGHFRITE